MTRRRALTAESVVAAAGSTGWFAVFDNQSGTGETFREPVACWVLTRPRRAGRVVTVGLVVDDDDPGELRRADDWPNFLGYST